MVLQINSKTFELFSYLSVTRFRERLLDIYMVLPDDQQALIDAIGINTFIDQVLIKSEINGIETERDIERFFELLAAFGLEFGMTEETSWVQDILEDSSLDGELKVDKIYTELSRKAPVED